MITVGDVISLASIWKVGASLGASLEEIKANLPAITGQALDMAAQISKLESLKSMPQLFQTLTVDLSVARDKEPHDITGGQIQAIDIDGDLDIQFNQSDSQAVNINKLRRLTVPFDKVFLTNAAQAGASATLFYGSGMFQVQDVAPVEINIIASEVTLDITIAGSTIMMPIDIQSSYIMMPIDIQAQYMNLAIDIVAQSIGNIRMDMVAQTIGNINVSIAGQIQNVTIDLHAQSVAIKSQAEWAPQQGQQKYVTLFTSALAFNAHEDADYQVTSGKTLYITHLLFSVNAETAANADLNQNGRLFLSNYNTSTYLAMLGGNGGHAITFPTPLRVPSEEIVRLRAYSSSNHNVTVSAAWGGYEI